MFAARSRVSCCVRAGCARGAKAAILIGANGRLHAWTLDALGNRLTARSLAALVMTDAKEAAVRVKAYFAALPDDARRELRVLRGAIRDAAPGMVDTFGYGIPGYKLDGRVVMWYAAWKQHSSIYPLSDVAKRKFGAQLEGYEMSKGTLRLPRDEPIPVGLIKKIVESRITELKAKARDDESRK